MTCMIYSFHDFEDNLVKMAHILVLDAIQQDIFVCGTCKLVYNSLQLFLNHKNTCGDEKGIADRNCSPSTMVKSACETELPSIVRKNNKSCVDAADSDIVCKYCKKKFKKVKTLLTHLKTHSDNPYQCPVCGRCFDQNSHLQRHILCHKVWPDGLSVTTPKTTESDLLCYACSYCSITLANYTQFRAHLKIHAALKKFKCIQNDCVHFYETMESLLNHVSLAHKNSNYSCHICKKNFNTLESIALHYQNHSSECVINKIEAKLHKCSQCDATFKRPENLSLHRLTETHKKSCIHCKKTFASDKRLRLHLQIHRNFKPFKCTICNSSFHMKKYLTTHMLKHGDRQFICAFCKCTFKRQDLLRRHMRLHQTKKLLRCPFRDTLDCKKEFTRNDKLKSHIKYHTKQVAPESSALPKPALRDAGTVEICIVPLDSKNNENEESQNIL